MMTGLSSKANSLSQNTKEVVVNKDRLDSLPSIGSLDHVQAMLSWRFNESPEVMELTGQLTQGLISPVEYSHKVLALWEDFAK